MVPLPQKDKIHRRQCKMSSSKKTDHVKGLCGRCLLELIDQRYSQSRLYFRLIFVSCCPSNLLFTSPTPPPFPVKYSIYRQWGGWEGGGAVSGVVSCWRPYSAGDQRSVSDQIQNLQNCYTTPNKNLGGDGASDKEKPAEKPLYR